MSEIVSALIHTWLAFDRSQTILGRRCKCIDDGFADSGGGGGEDGTGGEAPSRELDGGGGF